MDDDHKCVTCNSNPSVLDRENKTHFLQTPDPKKQAFEEVFKVELEILITANNNCHEKLEMS